MKKEREHIAAKNEMIYRKNNKREIERKTEENDFIRELFLSMPENIKPFFNDDMYKSWSYNLNSNNPYYHEEAKLI